MRGGRAAAPRKNCVQCSPTCAADTGTTSPRRPSRSRIHCSPSSLLSGSSASARSCGHRARLGVAAQAAPVAALRAAAAVGDRRPGGRPLPAGEGRGGGAVGDVDQQDVDAARADPRGGGGVRADRSQRAKGRNRRLKAAKYRGTFLESAAEIDALLAGAGDLDAERRSAPYRRALLAVLVFAGLRIDEALSLRWRHVSLPARTLKVVDAKTTPGAAWSISGRRWWTRSWSYAPGQAARRTRSYLPRRRAASSRRATSGTGCWPGPSSTRTRGWRRRTGRRCRSP